MSTSGRACGASRAARRRVQPNAAWAWWLALALLAAQALGLAHRVAHGPLAGRSAVAALHAPASPSTASAVQGPLAVPGPAAAHEDAAGLFDIHDAGGAECRLLDQAAQAEALLVAALPALPPRQPAQAPTAQPTARGAGPARAYLARGPPARALAGLHAA